MVLYKRGQKNAYFCHGEAKRDTESIHFYTLILAMKGRATVSCTKNKEKIAVIFNESCIKKIMTNSKINFQSLCLLFTRFIFILS